MNLKLTANPIHCNSHSSLYVSHRLTLKDLRTEEDVGQTTDINVGIMIQPNGHKLLRLKDSIKIHYI